MTSSVLLPLKKIFGAVRRRVRPIPEVPHRDYYSISIYRGPSPLALEPVAEIENPALKASDVTDVAATYVADPFMIRQGDKWQLFFEILCDTTGKGVIGVATSDDGMGWCYQQVVLDEPFHLSYPYVFEFEGEHYMVPESHQVGSVRLYKADSFPTGWRHVANLLEGDEFVDCSPFFHNGKWWMFAGGGSLPFRADVLRLFHADQLEGEWREHPCSPVIEGDPTIARPGGRVVDWGGRLFRFTQDCHPRYGLRVRAFEIHELTVETYRESAASAEPILRESGIGWNSSGMHHIDPHQLEDGSCLACVDGWYWDRVIERS
jgi:hypothetical protein